MSGVAVDEATGDVYVVDRGGERVEEFDAAGRFLAAWGWGVKDGAKEFEVCEAGCQDGLAGAGKGQFDAPDAIAVDNSTSASDPSKGDVYVVADGRDEHGHLEKFTADGEPLGAIKQEGVEAKWEGTLDGVAVDPAGTVWVYRGVEAEGHVEAFSDAGKPVFVEPAFEPAVICPKLGFAAGPAGTLYAGHERENREELCPLEEGEAPRPTVAAKLTVEGEALDTTLAAVDPSQTTGIAAEPSTGDVYLDNVSRVAVFDAAGSLVQTLTLPGQSPSGAGVAVNGRAGDVYVVDAAADTVDVFEAQQAGAPTVDRVSVGHVGVSSAELTALINPTGGDTEYVFQYGTVNCAESPSSCTSVPAAPVDIGSGFSDVEVHADLVGLSASTTYYYRVLASSSLGVAEGAQTFGSVTTLPSAAGMLDGRAWEMVSPAEKDGSGIEPLREEGGVIQASEDGNAITYVANGPIVAEPEGSRAPYPTQAIATRSASGWSSQELVTPRNKGEGFLPEEAPEYRFFTGDLKESLVQPDNAARNEPFEAPPLAAEATEKTMYVRSLAGYLPLVTPGDDTAGSRFGGELEFLDATPGLTHVVFASEVPLVAGASAGLYEWQAGKPLQPVSVLPDGVAAVEPVLGGEDHNVRGALAADGSRVFWSGDSEVAFGETTETVRHLYMTDTRTAHTIQLDAAAGLVGEPGEEESELGFQGANSEGTRVFFTDTARLTEESKLAPLPGLPGNPPDLYECEITEAHGTPACNLRDLTVDENPGENADVLNVAPAISENGSYVYFAANGVLAPGATPGHCVNSDEETPVAGATCNLYVLHEGVTSFIASLSSEDSGDWGSMEGNGARGASVEPRPDLADVTAGDSPDGQYFAFMSDQPLTGYDNQDTNPAANGARDEEVYLYNAASKLTLCASCNPAGVPPHGVFDTGNAGEGRGLLVDRRRDWAAGEETHAPADHWLAGSLPGWTPLGDNTKAAEALRPPRYLSDTGRLFFDSADALTPVEGGARTREESINGEAAQVGVESVYEYEPTGVGSCANPAGCVGLLSSGTSKQESAFVDASDSGDDAFFITAQPLVAKDHDTNFDLYDARTCTVLSPCINGEEATRTSCESSEACRPGEPAPPAGGGPSGTSTYTGPGNTPSSGTLANKGSSPPSTAKPLTRAQKLTRALKGCRSRWKHSKKRRAACERQARKTYTPKKTSHAKKASGHATHDAGRQR